MSLGNALQIGRSALATQQLAIEVTGNNLANLATEGFHRRRTILEPSRSREVVSGTFVGRGVQTQAISRQVDNALEARIRTNIADQSFSLARRDVLSQIEALFNEFSDADLSTHLNEFFNAWSELSNGAADQSLRTVVLRQASNLVHFVQTLRADMLDLRSQVDGAIDGNATAANGLLEQIELVNRQIITGGGFNGGAPALRDQRDGLLAQLGEYLDISVNEHQSGAIDVFVGSMPVILNGSSRGLQVRRESIDGAMEIDLVTSVDERLVVAASGTLASLIDARRADVNDAIARLDDFANQLIFEINRVHSQGEGLTGFDSVTGASRVLDLAATLDDEQTGLNFTAQHGSFDLIVRQKSTNHRTTHTIDVDLDGIDPANDATLPDIVAAIDAIDGVSASISTDGRLVVDSDGSDFEFIFNRDSSGALAALGVNSFFSGSHAGDITVNPVVDQNPSLLAAARDGSDNRNALDLAALKDEPIAALEGQTLLESWNRYVEEYAVRLSQANQQLDAEALVGDNLAAQQQSTSGVNADEEVINLLTYQRAYQGSARFLQVVDELLETLLSLV